MDPSAYLDIDRKAWNDRVDLHMQSEFCDLDAFLQGKCSLQPLEVELLGSLAGVKLLHLQCHFGQDSISLARRGANVTGVDLSDKGIEAAKELAAQGISCEVINIHTIKPLDEEAILDSVSKTRAVVVAEEHQRAVRSTQLEKHEQRNDEPSHCESVCAGPRCVHARAAWSRRLHSSCTLAPQFRELHLRE
mgnify:CR=1 FL=1